jgi:hypothetical protein
MKTPQVSKLNVPRLNAFSSKKTVSLYAISFIQHCFGVSSQCTKKQTNKKEKEKAYRLERKKYKCCRYHDDPRW